MNSPTLPVDWQLVSLREFRSHTIGAIDPQRFPMETFEYFSIPAYQQAQMPVRTLGREILSQKLLLPDHCVLFGKLNPRVEKVWFVSGNPDLRRLGSTEWLPVVPDNKTDLTYLYFVLRSEWVMPRARDLVSGSTPSRERVEPRSFYAIEVPRPPLEEQKGISAILSLVEHNLAKQEELASVAVELKQAAMRKLFTRGLRDEAQKETEIGLMPSSWSPRTILELCEIWSGGTPRKSVTEYWSGEVPWVSGKDLKLPALDDTIDHISAAGVEAGSRLAPQGAVLLLVRGMGLAKDLPVAVINRPMAFNQDVKALVSRGEYSGQYLRSAIYAGKERLLSQIVPSAHGTMTLNLNDVETFKVACPSDPDEATEIVHILDALDRKIALHRRKRTVLEELFQSLLHKLMTGEIRVCDLDLSALSTEVTV